MNPLPQKLEPALNLGLIVLQRSVSRKATFQSFNFYSHYKLVSSTPWKLSNGETVTVYVYKAPRVGIYRHLCRGWYWAWGSALRKQRQLADRCLEALRQNDILNYGK